MIERGSGDVYGEMTRGNLVVKERRPGDIVGEMSERRVSGGIERGPGEVVEK